MRYPIISSKTYKRTRYEILFDGVKYWVVKCNPKGIVRFLEGFEEIADARLGFERVTGA